MVNKNYFNLNKSNVMVEFRITGHNLDLSYITESLNVKPDEMWKKGEPIQGRKISRKYDCWAISTGYVESYDVNVQLDNIIDRLKDKKDILNKLRDELNLTYRIDIVINIENNEKPGLFLNNSEIEFAYDIKAEFDFDMYIYS